MPGNESKTRSVFPEVTEEVDWPDGGFYLEAMDAHGGWIGSAIDLLRFTTALDGTRQRHLLKTETTAQMISRGGHTPDTDPTYYGARLDGAAVVARGKLVAFWVPPRYEHHARAYRGWLRLGDLAERPSRRHRH